MPLLCFASPKGGVGKTTLAANVAWELARRGERVVALDLDPQNALRLHFGVSLHDQAGLMPVLRQQGPWQSALRQMQSGVMLLPHGQTGMDETLDLADITGRDPGMITRTLQEILIHPRTILIVDTAPGPSSALSSILPMTDFLATVLLPDATSIALIPAVEQGRAYGPANGSSLDVRHGFVLNQINPLSRLSCATGETVRRHLGRRLLGLISRDETVAEAIACQQSVSGFSPASRAAKDITLLAFTIAQRMREASQQTAPPSQLRTVSLCGNGGWRS